MKSPLHLVYIAALSAVIVLSYDFVLKSSAYHPSEDTLDAQLRFVKELRSRYTVDPPANPPAKDEVESKRRRALLEKRVSICNLLSVMIFVLDTHNSCPHLFLHYYSTSNCSYWLSLRTNGQNASIPRSSRSIRR